jgi:hypothetical protein
LLAYCKPTVKAVGRRTGQISWGSDYQGLRIKGLHLRLSDFRQFVGDILDSLVEIMHRDLFFGIAPRLIDLTKIKDVMTKDQPMFSFLTEPENGLPDGRAFMLDCMKQAPREFQLIDKNGVWNTDRIQKYFVAKERFLKLLMLGIFLSKRGLTFSHVPYRRSTGERIGAARRQVSKYPHDSP